MARRGVKPGQRAWFYNEGQVILGDGADATIQDVMNFGDIEVDETLVQRQRSEYYLERIIFWYNVSFVGSGSLLVQAQDIVRTRLGQIEISEWDTELADGQVQAPDYLANDFARIYQEDEHLAWNTRAFAYDGGALIVNSGESTSDAVGLPVPREAHKWDINVKTRIFEEQSIVFMLGARFPSADKTFTATWSTKCLLRRGK